MVSEIDSVPPMAYYTGMHNQLASGPQDLTAGECWDSCPPLVDGKVGKGKTLEGAVVHRSP